MKEDHGEPTEGGKEGKGKTKEGKEPKTAGKKEEGQGKGKGATLDLRHRTRLTPETPPNTPTTAQRTQDSAGRRGWRETESEGCMTEQLEPQGQSTASFILHPPLARWSVQPPLCPFSL